MTGVRVNSALAAYPVGAIYLSVSATSPATLFGGTWERITGRFLLAATDTGAAANNQLSNASIRAGYYGGEASHALTPGETAMKSHSHTVNSHSHTMAHSHGTGNATDTNFVVTVGGTSGGFTRHSAASGSALTNMVKSIGAVHRITSIGDSSAANTGNASPGTSGVTEANGSAHNNMPPFLAVYIWKRTA